MEQIGYITSILPNNKCRVLVSRISGCKGTCKTCAGCDTPQTQLIMDNTLDVTVGDYIKIAVDSRIVLKYSVFLYGFPLLCFILSIVLINSFFPNIKNIDIFSFVFGIGVMFLAFMIVKFLDKKYAHLSSKAMYMEKKISKKNI